VSEFKNGDTVFDIHGREGSYLARCSGGHVVQPVYTHDDDLEEYLGEPETWREVFKTPPTVKLHGEVAELEAKLNATRSELYQIQEQRRTEDRDYAARADERKRFAQLQTLDDFIAGKITHFFVVEGYGERMSIQAFDDFMKPADSDGSRYERKLRLLSLFGGSKGDLAWRVDHYSDGSGGSHGRVFPALSYEDAVRHASEWLEGRYADIRTKEHKHASLDLANAAERFGLSVPDDIAGWAKATADAAHAKNLEHARKQVADAQAKLQALEAQ
jgi:hypothetical protein